MNKFKNFKLWGKYKPFTVFIWLSSLYLGVHFVSMLKSSAPHNDYFWYMLASTAAGFLAAGTLVARDQAEYAAAHRPEKVKIDK